MINNQNTAFAHQPTLDFYNQHATEFYDCTYNFDLRPFYGELLSRIPKEAWVLDAGCGSGRDSLFFKQEGYKVCAIDGSENLASLASKRLALPVSTQTLEDMNFKGCFDGIWTCAVFQHVMRNSMQKCFSKLLDALKPTGWLYLTTRYGEGEQWIGERLFVACDEKWIDTLLENESRARLEKIWTTQNLLGQAPEGWRWLHVLVQRKS